MCVDYTSNVSQEPNTWNSNRSFVAKASEEVVIRGRSRRAELPGLFFPRSPRALLPAAGNSDCDPQLNTPTTFDRPRSVETYTLSIAPVPPPGAESRMFRHPTTS